jgi:hypothetical protein
MPPKKLRLNPPKNPSQQPTPRIKFTNFNKDAAQVGITVDEEARRRQDEHVRAASRGQILTSTETPVRMTQRGSANRDSPHIAAVSGRQQADMNKGDTSIASVGGDHDRENLQGDVSMIDAPADNEPSRRPSENEISTQTIPSTAPMQPTGVITQQPHPAPVAPPPPTRPIYQPTTAFERVLRNPGKGKAPSR